uniref:Uncharacterized protein n=1 Tax=viral metagenome TaxID=1070528 RepID=A0A6M3IWP4_9ZZZZ
MERILLVGADDVYKGGALVLEAAHEISSAASIIEFALSQHQRFMQQWLYNFQAIIEKKQVELTYEQ